MSSLMSIGVRTSIIGMMVIRPVLLSYSIPNFNLVIHMSKSKFSFCNSCNLNKNHKLLFGVSTLENHDLWISSTSMMFGVHLQFMEWIIFPFMLFMLIISQYIHRYS